MIKVISREESVIVKKGTILPKYAKIVQVDEHGRRLLVSIDPKLQNRFHKIPVPERINPKGYVLRVSFAESKEAVEKAMLVNIQVGEIGKAVSSIVQRGIQSRN